ncbi:MAG: Calcium-transporting ATPase 1 [Promethearchaeota archaeon]|nr:MAG: Calcium-transporting ATPase 1 [Candidatus Lokiarchaeota archaeon]
MHKNNNKTHTTNYYSIDVNDLLNQLNSDPQNGLTSSQADTYLQKYGVNELPEVKKGLWRIYLAPIFNFLILILIFSGIALIILGSPGETIITWVIVFINSITAIIQQFRAQKAIESLKKISTLRTIVIRDGKEKEIASKELVPGDIVLVSQGSKIPADARIIYSSELTINEAPLTGESLAVEKKETNLDKEDLPIQRQINMVFMGTYVNTGNAKVVIVKTGERTEIGKISVSLNTMGRIIDEIPLTKKLNHLAYLFGGLILINMSILILYKLFLLNQTVTKAFTDSIIRALNILPINLPLLVTLVLITGVLTMAQSGVIIKNLSAIESLGRISVICSDKTGTLTKNEMTIKKFWLNTQEFDVSGSGYDSEGDILYEEKPYSFTSATFNFFIDSMVLNNNARLVFEDIKIKTDEIKTKAIRRVLGSPTEGALLVLAEKAGFIIYDVKRKYEVKKEYPFESSLKRMTTVCRSNQNDQICYAFSKGAPEVLLELSGHIEIETKRKILDLSLKNTLLKSIEKNAQQGYRTLGIAYRKLNSLKDYSRKNVEQKLTFLGFVSIIDPPRIGVENAVKACQLAGIHVVMITGDHPATAKTIASLLHIFHEGDKIVEGKEIKHMNSQDLNEVSVFARVEPSEKEILVKKNQELDKVVAMTGDGINDSLALKHANCGVAMGITGTDIAKDSADMVISDDNFTSIKKGIEIGRGLFSKIRTIIFFFICIDIMEGFIFLGLEFFPAIELFSSNWQQIYIYGIVHSLPPIALILDTIPNDIMEEPPRNEEEIMNKNMWKLLIVGVVFIGISLLSILLFSLGGLIPLNNWNLDPTLSYLEPFASISTLTSQKARTMFITTLFIAEITLVWTARRPNKSLLKSVQEEFSLVLFFISIITFLIHFIAVTFSLNFNSFINDILDLNLQLNFMFLSFSDWMICLAFASIGIIAIELFKIQYRNKGSFF